MRPLVGLAGVLGAVSWLWVVVEARRGDLTLIVDFMRTDNPIYRAWHAVLPDYAHPGTRDWLLQAAWLATLALAAAVPSISLAREENTTRRATHVPA
jgi:hypothetical protein